MHTDRFYRSWVESDLTGFEAKVGETDLFILADKNLTPKALEKIIEYRSYIESYINDHPDFQTSFKPVPFDKDAPLIIKKMLNASEAFGVGPMAAVAGAMAEFVGKSLLDESKEIIVENGGDIFIKSGKNRIFSIFAGSSPLSGKIKLSIKGSDTPLGICTSSGTVGPSISFGKADAVTILSKDASLADAAATAVCNTVKTKDDINKSLKKAKDIEGVRGCVIIFGDRVGSIGEMELV